MRELPSESDVREGLLASLNKVGPEKAIGDLPRTSASSCTSRARAWRGRKRNAYFAM